MVCAPAIRTRSLTKYYGRTLGVDSVSLEVRPGEIVGFLGPNGSGKTTVIRMLMGLIKPTSGHSEIFGLDSAKSPPSARSSVGYLPGSLGLYDAMTAQDYFQFMARMRRVDCRKTCASLVDRLSFDPNVRIGTMSKGTRQKVGVVQAFMHSPNALVLDEPTSGLDPLVQHEFEGILREACRNGTAVLLSSHVLADVERVADRVAILDRGRLVAFDDVGRLPGRDTRMVTLEFAAAPEPGLLSHLPGFETLACEGRLVTGISTGSQAELLETALRNGLAMVTSRERPLEDLFRGLVGHGDGTRT